MSDWTWEYNPDSAHVVGGLTPELVAEVEALAQRIADAISVRRIGKPFDEREAASNLLSHANGLMVIWYQEYYVESIVLVVRVQHLGPDG